MDDRHGISSVCHVTVSGLQGMAGMAGYLVRTLQSAGRIAWPEIKQYIGGSPRVLARSWLGAVMPTALFIHSSLHLPRLSYPVVGL